MKKPHIIGFLVTLLLTLTLTGAVSAQEGDTTQTIVGTIVGVDPVAGTVDVLQPDGTIVTINIVSGDYDHPIVELLAEYFGGDGIEDWGAALEALEIDGGTAAAIIEVGDGEWEITLDDGSVITTDDADLAEAIAEALDTLNVGLNVTDDGEGLTMVDVGEQIAAYHDMGIGFGELVKIYTIAQESQAACEAEAEANGTEVDPDCAITVEELVEMVLNGMDMGTLFDMYGKPSLLGVGHVRQALGGFNRGGGGGGDGGDGGGGDACKDGGWEAMGFRNQGQCVSSFNH